MIEVFHLKSLMISFPNPPPPVSLSRKMYSVTAQPYPSGLPQYPPGQPQYPSMQPQPGTVMQSSNTTVVINQQPTLVFGPRYWQDGLCGCFDDCGSCTWTCFIVSNHHHHPTPSLPYNMTAFSACLSKV